MFVFDHCGFSRSGFVTISLTFNRTVNKYCFRKSRLWPVGGDTVFLWNNTRRRERANQIKRRRALSGHVQNTTRVVAEGTCKLYHLFGRFLCLLLSFTYLTTIGWNTKRCFPLRNYVYRLITCGFCQLAVLVFSRKECQTPLTYLGIKVVFDNR